MEEKNNRDAVIAKSIADKLNVPWSYIEYNNSKMKNIFLSQKYLDFVKFSDNLTSVHFPKTTMPLIF